MQSTIAQLIVICKNNAFSYISRTPPNYSPPPRILTEPNVGGVTHGVGMKRRQADWGWLRHRQCNQPHLLMIGIRHKIIGMGLVEWWVMLAPTIDSEKVDAEGRRPRCENEAALSSLSLRVAAPQAMKSPIATDH
jgi:hypothetical protein